MFLNVTLGGEPQNLMSKTFLFIAKIGYKAHRYKLALDQQNGAEDCDDIDHSDFQSTNEIVLSPNEYITSTLGNSYKSEEQGTEGSSSDVAVYDDLEQINSSDLSRTSSESQLHMMSIELANRGPQQSDIELRYLHQVLTEAECYDWCILICFILRDQPLFVRSIQLATSLNENEAEYLDRLCQIANSIKLWASTECLGYKPFLTSVAPSIEALHHLNAKYKPRRRHSSSQHSSDSANNDSNEKTTTSTVQNLNNSDNSSKSSQSDTCIIS